MPWPVLMLDVDMRVLDANRAAQEFLTVAAPITLAPNGSLHFHDKTLKLALARVLSMEAGRDTQMLSSPAGKLSLLCTPLAKSDALGAISTLRAIVWIISNDNKVVPSPDVIQSVFGLTLAEARLLHLLCKEGSLNECANGLQVSIHTVRSQLKSIMAKANVSSQVELVSQTMGHSFLQAANQQARITREEMEQQVLLPDGRVLSWFEFGSPQGQPVLTLENIGAGLPDHQLHHPWYCANSLRVINIIRPGYGTSTFKPQQQFADLSDDIQFLCEHLNIVRPVMATYCVGGAYALCAAALKPNLFERLGVLGTTVPIEYWELDKLDWMHAFYLKMYRVQPQLFAMAARLAVRGVRRSPEKSLQRLSKAFSKRDAELLNNPAIIQRVLQVMRLRQYQGAEVIVNEYMLLQEPWNVDFSCINIPVLLWHGEDDPTISIGSARALAAAIPNASIEGLAGHGRLLVHDVWRDFLVALMKH
jgi:pimeloyl-ACP methyl ester carboxylesterase/DNA-binding CsgD family transcriptional regulator